MSSIFEIKVSFVYHDLKLPYILIKIPFVWSSSNFVDILWWQWWCHDWNGWWWMITEFERRLPSLSLHDFEGFLPKGPYLPCVSLAAGRALLAGYPRIFWYRSYLAQCVELSPETVESISDIQGCYIFSQQLPYSSPYTHRCITHWGRDKMVAICQTTFSNAFSWMKIIVFWWKCHWNLFPRVQLTIFQR